MLPDLNYKITAEDRSKSAFNSFVNSVDLVDRRMRDTTRNISGATSNLAAQFNDIGVQLAGGQSPFLIALQQGSQINQVLGQQGAAGAVKLLGGAFASLINPVSLATIGVITAAGAIYQYATEAGDDVRTLDDVLGEHRRLIESLRDAYDLPKQAAKDYAKETTAELEFQIRATSDALERQIEASTKAILGNTTQFEQSLSSIETGLESLNALVIKPDFKPFEEAIFTFRDEVGKSESAFADFRDEVARLANLDPTNEGLQKTARFLRDVSQAGFQAEAGARAAKDALDEIAGIGGGDGSNIGGAFEALANAPALASQREDALERLRRQLGGSSTRSGGGGGSAAIRLTEPLKLTDDGVNKLNQSFKDLGQTQINVGEIGRMALGGLLNDLRQGKDASDALRSALDRVADRLFDFGFNTLFNALGGGFSLGGGASGASKLGFFDGFFADGGFIRPGHFGVVGEAGAEVVRAGSAGATVTPMGGGAVNIVIENHSRADVSPSVERGANGDTMVRFVMQEVNKGILQGRSDAAFKGRFGASPNKVRR